MCKCHQSSPSVVLYLILFVTVSFNKPRSYILVRPAAHRDLRIHLSLPLPSADGSGCASALCIYVGALVESPGF